MTRPIGVLALQGGYGAHCRALEEIGLEAVEIREDEQLSEVDGLVLPGGESTTHLKLIERFGLGDALDAFVRSGRPVLGTCAGLILAAKTVIDPAQHSFGWLDLTVSRNGWGRQVHSFEATRDMSSTPDLFGPAGLPMIFIRAPRIQRLGESVEVLVQFEGEPVMVREGNVYGASFHPELTEDRRVHQLVFKA